MLHHNVSLFVFNLQSVRLCTRTENSGCNKSIISVPVKNNPTGSVHGIVYDTERRIEEMVDKCIDHCLILHRFTVMKTQFCGKE